MACAGRDKHLSTVPCFGTPFTRAGHSELHPTQPWTIPGMWQPQLPWTTCSSASPASQGRIFFLLLNLNLLCFSLKPFPLALSLHALGKVSHPSCRLLSGTEGLQLGHPKASFPGWTNPVLSASEVVHQLLKWFYLLFNQEANAPIGCFRVCFILHG